MLIDKSFTYWSNPTEEICKILETSFEGISEEKALQRLAAVSENKISSPFIKGVILFLSQFKNPLTFLLLFALVLSASVGEYTNSSIIFCILFITGFLGFIQERNASKAVEKLRMLVQSKAKVKRNGVIKDIQIKQVVPGDIVMLEAGDMIPADGLIIEAKDLYVNEATLTGESFPSEKKSGISAKDVPLSERKNTVYKGTSVISGTATIIAIYTGKDSELGQIEKEVGIVVNETAFEKGIRSFGYMLMRIALIMAGIILIINIALGRPPLDSVLFALALSVGLAPELLPAIVTITLSAGAKRLADKKVIVKKLASIQNLGSVDILCSDKTGTLTEGEIKIHSYVACDGKECNLIKEYAYLNAFYETGYPNPVDNAIRRDAKTDIETFSKFDEVPYDFIRKRLSIVVLHNSRHIMITKGALNNVMEVCNRAQSSDGTINPIETISDNINKQYQQFSSQGFRTLGICYKDVTDDPVINKDDETEMMFLGFILLNDPLKDGIIDVINELKEKKVNLKIITGDNKLVAINVAGQIGLLNPKIITGGELHNISNEALVKLAGNIDIFSETEPSQKERIVHALQKAGHVVGYLGDGINDASALKVSDVGISVNNAVDIAKEAADIILLEKNLKVISEGITEGRKTFQNTLKYIFITVSANFGNMFSMAGASLLLPFLPLLPAQILFMNLLSDIPALAIASDSVDSELLQQPRKWNIKLISKFMIVFGLESSIFDYITFGTLILLFGTKQELFRAGWFTESVITAILTLLIIRTRRLFIKSLPGKYLIIAAISIIILVVCIPYIPALGFIGFSPLPFPILISMILICILFGMTFEISKKIFFKKLNY
ncbi:MAG: magnesium-translocating P-type ATPase [Bacteroidota bacterium]